MSAITEALGLTPPQDSEKPAGGLAPPVPAATVADSIAAQDSVATGTASLLSEAQIASARADWIGRGLSAEKFDEAVKPVEEGRDPASGQFTAEVEYPPSAYRPDFGPLARGLDVADLGKFSGMATKWLSGVGVEPSLGASLLQHLMANSRAFSEQTPAQRSLTARSERLEALRMCGGDETALAERLQLVGQALRRGDAEFNSELLQRNAFASAFAIMTISTAEKISEARATARKAAKP